MALPRVAEGEEGLQVWRVAANVKRTGQRKRGVTSHFGTRAGLRNSLEQIRNFAESAWERKEFSTEYDRKC